jgi:holo-[acyl-carrier protein] synthase
MESVTQRLLVGTDLVQLSRVRESIATFGDRFLRRVFTEGELAYANAAPDLASSRLAARLAAKEATLKALDLVEHGIGWHDIEIARGPSGAPSLLLRGTARAAAEEAGLTEGDLALSLSHEGDYATAVVIALRPSSVVASRHLTSPSPVSPQEKP